MPARVVELPPQQSPLEYAAAPLRVNRRKLIRRAAVLIVLAAATFAALRWGQPLIRQARLLHNQRRCLAHSAPADQVVAAEPLPVLWETKFAYERPDPPELKALLAASQGEVAGLDGKAGPVLFMHERTTKSGRRRLVILRRVPPVDRTSIDIPISFHVTLIDPATLRRPPTATAARLEDVVSPAYADQSDLPPALRFFAGQPDLADSSHFVVRYEVNGAVGEVHGWLRDASPSGSPSSMDGVNVDLESR